MHCSCVKDDWGSYEDDWRCVNTVVLSKLRVVVCASSSGITPGSIEKLMRRRQDWLENEVGQCEAGHRDVHITMKGMTSLPMC